MSDGVNGTLLVVCAANVCRSPYAAFLLGRSLPDVEVRSAGVTARAGDPLCRFTEERIDALPGGAEFSAAHVATRLDIESLSEADLILTASEAERSAVAVLDPGTRPRTFTLVEAAYSAAALGSAAQGVGLRELAGLMHAQRGMIDLPEARRPRWVSLRRPSYGIAIPDAHIGDARRHDEVYRTVTEAVDRFTAIQEKEKVDLSR